MAYTDDEILELYGEEIQRGSVTAKPATQPHLTRDMIIKRKAPTLSQYDNKHYTNHTNGNNSDDEETFEIRDGW